MVPMQHTVVMTGHVLGTIRRERHGISPHLPRALFAAVVVEPATAGLLEDEAPRRPRGVHRRLVRQRPGTRRRQQGVERGLGAATSQAAAHDSDASVSAYDFLRVS